MYVKYSAAVKALAVKLYLQGREIEEINDLVEENISLRSFQRWRSLFEQTASVVRDPALYEKQGRPLAIDTEGLEFMRDILVAEPSLYVDEIQKILLEHFGVTFPLSTIKRDLHLRLHMSLKVARTVNPSQCPIKRAIYTGQVADLPSHYLVFTDETGVCMDELKRRRAWAPVGERTERLPRTNQASRISVLPAVSLDGVLGVIAQPGSIQRLDFEFFLEEILLPAMNPFPGRNSVLVMDNASIHHHGNVANICAAAHVLLIYLPPYSPDFNPIEKVFSVLKSHLRRDQILLGNDDDARLLEDYVYEIVTPELMSAEFRGCGYA